MQFLVTTTTHNNYDIRIGEGPGTGTLIGQAEQVRMSAVEIEDGPVFLGRISAVWGLELDPGLDMNAQVTKALGIGKAFPVMPFGGRAKLVHQPGERGFLLDLDGRKLAACAALHLGQPGIYYSLHNYKTK